jgi:hypothetical protein
MFINCDLLLIVSQLRVNPVLVYIYFNRFRKRLNAKLLGHEG